MAGPVRPRQTAAADFVRSHSSRGDFWHCSNSQENGETGPPDAALRRRCQWSWWWSCPGGSAASSRARASTAAGSRCARLAPSKARAPSARGRVCAAACWPSSARFVRCALKSPQANTPPVQRHQNTEQPAFPAANFSSPLRRGGAAGLSRSSSAVPAFGAAPHAHADHRAQRHYARLLVDASVPGGRSGTPSSGPALESQTLIWTSGGSAGPISRIGVAPSGCGTPTCTRPAAEHCPRVVEHSVHTTTLWTRGASTATGGWPPIPSRRRLRPLAAGW